MTLTTALVWLTLLLGLGVVGVMAGKGQVRRWRWFAGLLMAAVVMQGITLVMTPQHRLYPRVFLVGTLASCLLTAAAAVELVERIFSGFAGLRSTSVWVVRLAAGGATVFGGVTAWSGLGPTETPFHFWFRLVMSLQKGLMVSLAVFLLVVLGVIAVLRAKLPALQRRYAAVFCVFFLAKTAALLYFDWAGRQAVGGVRDVLLLIQVLCLGPFGGHLGEVNLEI